MRLKISAYWWCQLGGWLFYSLAMVFFAFVFEQKYTNIFYSRLAIGVFAGIFFTHLLRLLIIRFKMRPPTEKQRWFQLALLILTICVIYNMANSAIVEWFKLYDPIKKISFEKRFLGNLIFDSPLIFIWTSIYFVWHYIEAGRKNEIQQVRLETLVKELELKTIKSHINPHFIFNALNSIRALVDENPDRARTAITELSNILRSSMQAEKLELAPFEKELGIVKDYLALEHIRFEDRLRIEYDIDEDTMDQPVPPMMLQTLVENAIKHGISQQKEGGVVRVISDFRDNHHELIVQNSGHLNGNLEAAADGFGINSTRNRLKLLFGGKASFEIRDTDNGMVEAVVKMPVKDLHY
ncbi:MAG: sensor histidine kinase [Bacteroidetes bacterium 24-39-8]|jgi:sensor histidine kinase YesM|nr:MAG: sensor histidine kinase [Bacteroidetes bacterium 24-39-8]OZA69716.1 MAG: sensor histidine kinase [Sphingobacteriia bacterium 39-39-8]HQR94741.1 histidine kinase [Sediminibacterium sp.]HQS56337.1 histidine kinase [Sediminibacterium sp.]